MTKFGWIKGTSDFEKKVEHCLQFFNAPDVGSWRREYGDVLQAVAFRTSATFDSEPGAVLAWLRYGEMQSEKISCRPWNGQAFKAALAEMRQLTRLRSPRVFLNRLRTLCAKCGVALVIAKAPQGCRASGATRFIAADKAMILLSFRHLSDDQFWFTFFHEAAHLILHSKKALFLEDHSEVTSTEEQEANEFAEDVLIPRNARKEIIGKEYDRSNILRLAVKLGLARGIVVGQLQHQGLIRADQFNWLKRRFNWKEIEAAI
jgi:Zn-dependent peptidase ImmA (M78 family)